MCTRYVGGTGREGVVFGSVWGVVEELKKFGG